MARTLTPKDARALLTAVARQATGQSSIAVYNSADFVSVGETVLATGMENVFNALNTILASTVIAVRPYKAQFGLSEVDGGLYGLRKRKISYYSKDPENAGDFNTDLFTNFADGFTAGENLDANGVAQSTKSQWVQNAPMPLEQNFGGVSVWQYNVTNYEEAVKIAFTSEEEFNKFVTGYLQEHVNDIEQTKEAWNRMAFASKIGQVYDMSANMSGSVVNLTSAFNTRFGTSYTSAQLRTTYLKEFLAFFVATFKETSRMMRNRSTLFHYPATKTINGTTYSVLRHTPKEKQRAYLYGPLFTEAEALVLPEIFNDEYLKLDTQAEIADFWQTPDGGAALKVTPPVLNTSTGLQEAGTSVDLAYLVGAIMDEDALKTNWILESARTTPVEARKGYRNTWNNFARNAWVDPTENCVIFIMAD